MRSADAHMLTEEVDKLTSENERLKAEKVRATAGNRWGGGGGGGGCSIMLCCGVRACAWAVLVCARWCACVRMR